MAFGRHEREEALWSGADVVVIATTSFLPAIADDVRDAVEAGSNVITTAEEAAYPWANDPLVADSLDALGPEPRREHPGCRAEPGLRLRRARPHGVWGRVGGGVTACDAGRRPIRLRRDLLSRFGVGYSPEALPTAYARARSPATSASPSRCTSSPRLDVEIKRIDRSLEPLMAERDIAAPHLTIRAGETAGFEQRYTAFSEARPWFEALFTGHVAPSTPASSPVTRSSWRERRRSASSCNRGSIRRSAPRPSSPTPCIAWSPLGPAGSRSRTSRLRCRADRGSARSPPCGVRRRRRRGSATLGRPD